ncbi:phage tail protein [Kerstersia gyiorum]|uniref:Minor tail family protein n=1 Tax=Kerstersia gyiorum TaxID=206506 RepID=A0A171KSH7_9BURK|nr:phage tail protein [Kerstersia gyiorum]KKO71844.1 minor tail family protein [Kerstersia gyiorum]
MAYETFAWCPLTDPDGTSKFRVLSAQFGDGYAQEAGDGINNETRSWPLQFVGREHDIKPIRDFLRRHQGFKPFLWTPPMEDRAGLFIVREFTLKPMGGKAHTLSATFEERFSS